MSEVTSAPSGGTVLAETLWAAFKASEMNQPTSALDKIVFVSGVDEAYRLGGEVMEAAIRAPLEARIAALETVLGWYAEDDARSVEMGLLEKVSDRPAAAALAGVPKEAGGE